MWWLKFAAPHVVLMDPAGDGTGGEGGGGGDGGDGGDGGEGGGGDGDGGQAKGGGDGDGGKPKLSDSEAKLLKESMQRKKALEAANKKVADLETKLKDFEGIDAGEIKKLLKEKQDAEAKQLEAKGEWDKLKQQMADAHRKELETLSGENQSLKAQIQARDHAIAEMTVGVAFRDSKFIREEMAMTPSKARKAYGEHFEFKDGQVVAFDKPAGDASRVMLVDGQGNPLSFEAAISKIVAADPEADQVLKSKLKAGANSGGTPTKKGQEPAKSTVTLYGRDRIAAALAAQGK